MARPDNRRTGVRHTRVVVDTVARLGRTGTGRAAATWDEARMTKHPRGPRGRPHQRQGNLDLAEAAPPSADGLPARLFTIEGVMCIPPFDQALAGAGPKEKPRRRTTASVPCPVKLLRRLHPLGCGRAGQLARRPSPDLCCRPPHTYFKRTVTPPTAADTSAPTFGPLSCRITPLAFCN